MTSGSDTPTPLDDPTWGPAIDAVCAGVGLATVFQPIVDLRRGVVVGYEALSRLSHPGIVGGPDRWFAAAHRAGRSADLDAAALAAGLAHRPALDDGCFLSVNVEPGALASDAVTRAFAAAGGLAGVVVEITEHRPVDPLALEPTLDRLRGDGAVIAVDDAGAGYAGLAEILLLRPAIVKLDRSLVHGIDHDEAKATLVEMLATYSARVGAQLVAEGVETTDELRRLVALGVPLAQGWALARPAAPWPPLTAGAAAVLADRPVLGEPLRGLVQAAPTALHGSAALARLVAEAEASWVVVLDGDDRPLGVLTPAAALGGVVLPALRVEVTCAPAELAHRMSTTPHDPATPALVVDRAGRHLGIVTLRRLLAEVARLGLAREDDLLTPEA